MTAALLVQCSPRFEDSVCRTASERLIRRLRQREPGLRVLRRDVAADPPPLVDRAFTEAMHVPAAARDDAQRRALAVSEALIAELEATAALVIGTPMHNFTVPASLKAWIDQVVRVGRTFGQTEAGKRGLLADRPTYVVIASGGRISGERARQPDFLTPYLQAILATIGIRSTTYLHLEATSRLTNGSAPAIEARVEAWLDTHLPVARIPRGVTPCGRRASRASNSRRICAAT